MVSKSKCHTTVSLWPGLCCVQGKPGTGAKKHSHTHLHFFAHTNLQIRQPRQGRAAWGACLKAQG